MAVIAFLGTFYTTPKLISNEYADESQRTKTIISRTLNLFVIAIPPALPTAVGCGVAFAAARLRTLKIFTTSPQRINLAGRIKLFVFDKTGTLTEDGLSVLGVRCAIQKNFDEFKNNSKSLEQGERWWLS